MEFLNVIPGYGDVGEALGQTPMMLMQFHFTGSTEVGGYIYEIFW